VTEANELREPASIDMKFEVAVIPASNVDRAKGFYAGLGWRLDADYVRVDGSRGVQLTPPGSPASIQLDSGPAARFYLVVTDIEAARAELESRGVQVSEVFHRGAGGRLSGPDPERRSYQSFVTFNDPDGNNWLVQEVTQRLPGRVAAANTTFASSADLAAALRRAAAAHGEHEKRTGEHDADWSTWCAEYIAREQSGQQLSS
jgi:catechol 2,3-dioxygenase-like lactoylglutathione lyase family enzyme